MGLGRAIPSALIELKRQGAFDEGQRVVEIGAQQLADDFLVAPELGELYDLFDRPLIDLGAPVGRDNFASRAPSSRRFWLSLGFEYMAIDLVGDAFRLDLNDDSVPRRLRNQFDIVINAGTTEHVANQENAFRVIHVLARPGGIMLHELPCQGMLTHGLINYSPKFFWHLCRENRYDVMWLTISCDGASTVPQDVIDSNLRFGGRQSITSVDVTLPDVIIRAALKKRADCPFVTPLDVPADADWARIK